MLLVQYLRLPPPYFFNPAPRKKYIPPPPILLLYKQEGETFPHGMGFGFDGRPFDIKSQ